MIYSPDDLAEAEIEMRRQLHIQPNKPLQVTATTVTIAAYTPIAPVAAVPDL